VKNVHMTKIKDISFNFNFVSFVELNLEFRISLLQFDDPCLGYYGLNLWNIAESSVGLFKPSHKGI